MRKKSKLNKGIYIADDLAKEEREIQMKLRERERDQGRKQLKESQQKLDTEK